MRPSLFPAGVFFLLTGIAFAQEYSADQPAFSASPQALQKTFANIEPGADPATLLLESARYEFDAQGRQTYRYHSIFKIWTKSGAENWAMVERAWAPWLEERPTVRARVITPDGSVHEFDPKTMGDSPVRDGDDVLSDRRKVQAPLPAVEPGSIVEEEVVLREVNVSPVPGTVSGFTLGAGVAVIHSRIEIRCPEALPLRFKLQLLPDAVVSDKKTDGMREITVDQGKLKPFDEVEPWLPSDEPRYPAIAISTASDWHSIAAAYHTVVEAQLKGFDAASHLPKFARNAPREEKILAVVNQLNKEIRYTGIEFSEASIVPHKPAEVLDHKYGDCKDKSALAVALLRAAGIEAHVALLNSSLGKDVEPDLPGLGRFNHAIVYVPGKPDYWLDPTDTDLRLGVVSPDNQGRYALIVRPQTTALIRTPELTAEDNRVVETREFRLAELGNAKVTESSQVFGTPDRQYRAEFGDLDQKALLEKLKPYVEWTYREGKPTAASHGDEADLTKPFQLKMEVDEAKRGVTERTEAAVGILLSQIALRLPDYFRTDPEAEKKKQKDDKPVEPRKRDYAISEPFTYEWHYIITSPPGFKLRQLPEAAEESLGPASLSWKFATRDEHTVTGDFRFVMAKRRFSAAEGAALRDAIVKLAKRPGILVYFDQVGETALASGNVKDALAEFAALRKLHPNEALHAMQTARALLAAGAGNTARAEARRAVDLEPNSAKAYVQLAEVLKHDLIGRNMKKGYDGEGAAAAYRKALEIDPKDDATRANLAILLEYNRDGVRYGNGAKLEEALAEYRKMLDKLADLQLPNNYPIALLWAGHPKELNEYLAHKPDSEENQMLRVSAEALLNGSAAGIRQSARTSGVAGKSQVLTSAGQTLVRMRQYALAADLLDAAATGSQNAAALTNMVQILRNTRRCEDRAGGLNRPEDTVMAFFTRILFLDAHEKDWMEPLSSYAMEGDRSRPADIRRGLAFAMGNVRNSGLSTEVTCDLGLSAMQLSKEGNDEDGWVVRLNIPSSGGTLDQNWFVMRQDGKYRVVGTPDGYEGIARLVLHLADEGKVDRARIWLDRVRQELPAGSGDDPLSGSMFSRVWQQGQEADAKTVRTAAALLLSDQETGIATTVSILEDAHKSADRSIANFLAAALTEGYFTAKQYDKALPAAEALIRALPRSGAAAVLALRAAYAVGGKKEAGRIADTILPNFKNNVQTLRVLGSAALSDGNNDLALAIEKQLIDSGRASDADYNQLAWSDVMADRVTQSTLDFAKRGMLMGQNRDTALMHTLACVQVELDLTSDARAAILQRIDTLGHDEPDDSEWYVFGRIAEKFGLKDDATAMYRKLEKPQNEMHIPSSSYALAQRRLKAMGAAAQ